jgi:hypothetical protein
MLNTKPTGGIANTGQWCHKCSTILSPRLVSSTEIDVAPQPKGQLSMTPLIFGRSRVRCASRCSIAALTSETCSPCQLHEQVGWYCGGSPVSAMTFVSWSVTGLRFFRNPDNLGSVRPGAMPHRLPGAGTLAEVHLVRQPAFCVRHREDRGDARSPDAVDG